MGKWKKAKDMDDLVKKAAKDAGCMPYQVKVKGDGDIVARGGSGDETVIGRWTTSGKD